MERETLTLTHSLTDETHTPFHIKLIKSQTGRSELKSLTTRTAGPDTVYEVRSDFDVSNGGGGGGGVNGGMVAQSKIHKQRAMEMAKMTPRRNEVLRWK